MCLLPEEPKLPEIKDPNPKPEETAKAPIIGRKRKSVDKTPSSRRNMGRLGVSSLRIPKVNSGRNLNY